VHELGLHGDKRQAVALHRLDDACLERALIGVAQEGRERSQPVVGGLELPLPGRRRIERHGDWCGAGGLGAVGHGVPYARDRLNHVRLLLSISDIVIMTRIRQDSPGEMVVTASP
jgi:hypothetical protein